MRNLKKAIIVSALCLLSAGIAIAQVTPQEAEQLKNGPLTPLGAEKAGNKEGTIPAWTGGMTAPLPGWKSGEKRPDPFPGEKPMFSITSKNYTQYADKLADGTIAMFKKYPEYRVDVYPSHRTMAAPKWMYDNTFKNATRAKLVNGPAGPQPQNVFGGIPFPIPKNGIQVMWNHEMKYCPESWYYFQHNYLITADNQKVLLTANKMWKYAPYYFKDGSPDTFKDGNYFSVKVVTTDPPIRAGENVVENDNMNAENTDSWIYLTGQRRVRKLPNPCCDTPNPVLAGVMSQDDVLVFYGRLDRYDWKLLGKKEMYIPYNSNKLWLPEKDSTVLGAHFLNPDYVRWELHRVWVVDATLAAGKRHQSPHGRYYIDEDSWMGVIGDRWDSGGKLWKTDWVIPVVEPDWPGGGGMTNDITGFYDLISGRWCAAGLENESTSPKQQIVVPRIKREVFSADELAGEGVR